MSLCQYKNKKEPVQTAGKSADSVVQLREDEHQVIAIEKRSFKSHLTNMNLSLKVSFSFVLVHLVTMCHILLDLPPDKLDEYGAKLWVIVD